MANPPSKDDRTKCYDARDGYWKCLNEIEMTKEDAKKCDNLRKIFTDSCPQVWVKHFDRKREYEKYKLREAMENLSERKKLSGISTN